MTKEKQTDENEEIIKEIKVLRTEVKDLSNDISELKKGVKEIVGLIPKRVEQSEDKQKKKKEPQKAHEKTGIKDIDKSKAIPLMEVKIVGKGHRKQLPDGSYSTSWVVRDDSLESEDSGAFMDLNDKDSKKVEKGDELKLIWGYAKKQGEKIWLKKGTNGEIKKI